MFIVAQSEEFKAPVQVKIVGKDGKPVTHKFNAIFKRPEQEERDEFDKVIVERAKLRRAQINGQEIDENRLQELEDLLADQRIIDTYLTGWDGVMASPNEPLEFNPDNLATVLKIVGVRLAISTAFFNTLDNKRGN